MKALRIKGRERYTRSLIFQALIVAILCASATSSQAQLPPSPEHGFQPAGAYALSSIESINTANGNMIVRVPLAALPPGRGNSPGFELNLNYNSKLYDTHIEEIPDQGTGQIVQQIHLNPSEQGGWHYNDSSYHLQLINRIDIEGWTSCIVGQCGTYWLRNAYVYKLKVIFPDSGEHEFRPLGYTDYLGDGYYDINPNGLQWGTTCNQGGCNIGSSQATTAGMTYYSTDGSFMRLDIPYAPGGGWMANWTLSFPDGRRVITTGGVKRTYDRNNNYTETQSITYNGHPAKKILDQLGRSIIIEYDGAAARDYIYLTGPNGEELKWTIKWKTVYAYKPYRATTNGTQHGNVYLQTGSNTPSVVDQIILPVQAGSLAYTFAYNAPDTDPYPNYSHGWGEISSITLPSGTQANYTWTWDGPGPGLGPFVSWVLQAAVTRKDLNYVAEYDGSSTPITDTWTYSVPMNYGTAMVITGPDGGVTRNYSSNSGAFARLAYKTENPDGSLIERVWQSNIPYLNPPMNTAVNPHVKTEFTSIKDGAGNLSLTAIKDYNYDKNGNVTQVKEYDWVDYASAHPGGGGPVIPSGVQPKRITVNTFFNSTADASDTSYNANVYNQPSAPQSRNVSASSEVRDNAQTFSRSEFFYDNPLTTANPTQQKSWDSTKGAYSNPLMTSNSISISTQYNAYGSPILTTDAKGFQTQLTYGAIGGFTDLYPTLIKTAYGTSVQRSEARDYSFHTASVTRVTDVDNNNVSTSTAFDAFGRPTLVRAADGKPEESRTVFEYSDTLRRVITRADLNTMGDAKLVTIQHYDQQGRVRLSRKLEDAATQSATDETTGIKVQTRYVYSGANSYQLVSNPYRAATSAAASGEVTMGWTRTKADNGGRVLEVQTFGSAGLPAPWGASTISTGTVTTAYDANFTTVTEQMLKVRRSRVDGLGRLVRIDEPDETGNGNLGATNNPFQPTSYVYDALGNLRQVIQESQQRFFMYDSLSRLQRSRNPEQATNASLTTSADPISGNTLWSVGYAYDNNGNLTQKVDPRGVTTDYGYDFLNRNTTVDYSDTSGINPDISRFYDGAVNGKGRFWYNYAGGNSSAGSNVEHTAVDSYDALGRPLVQRQLFKLNGSWGLTYQTLRGYNLADGVISQTYPSGRTVSYGYDNAGRTNAFTGNLGDGVSRTYATGIVYSPAGGLSQEQFGTDTPLYNKSFYTSRGQLAEIRVGTTANDTGWNRGAIINQYSHDQCWGMCEGSSMTDNNGNLKRQEVYIPHNDGISSYTSWYQQYDYDNLNRLKRVHEYTSNPSLAWQQEYRDYDRWGNRRIDPNSAKTYGAGINNLDFEVEPATNRMYSPGDLALPDTSRRMRYDNAGNLTKDTYTGAGDRTYDAENRMTQAWANGQWQSYTYNADGQRVRRKVNGVESWQIYGIDGELLAEYQANGGTASPQKEYGYRNGQLLVEVTATGGSWGSPPTFTPPNPLVAGVTEVKALHITDLRTAINALRGHLGLSAFSWQQPAAPGDWIKADPILEMRTALDQALGPPSPAYSAGLAQGLWIKKDHIQELRDRVLAAWNSSSGGTEIRWLVADHLGTPRIIIDKTGALANVKRHDYLPFGEELNAGTGDRTTQLGYAADNIRQKFTLKERDNETGLDFFEARYYSSTQGRFTSPDDPFADWNTADPQRWNLYSYTSNSPLDGVDANGERWAKRQRDDGKWEYTWFDHLEQGKDGTTAYDRALAGGWSEVSDFPLIVTEDGTGRRLLLGSTDGGRTPTVEEVSQAEEGYIRYQVQRLESARAWEKWWDLPGLERELDALPMAGGAMATRRGILKSGMKFRDAVSKLKLRGLSLTSGMKKLRELGLNVRMTKDGRREFYDTVTGTVRAAWDESTRRWRSHWHKFAPDGKTPLNDAGRIVDKNSSPAHIPSKGKK